MNYKFFLKNTFYSFVLIFIWSSVVFATISWPTTPDGETSGWSIGTLITTFTIDSWNVWIGKTPTTKLDVNGTISATTIAWTLTTATQPNITSLWTISSLSATLTTSAQPNITSIWTLNSLSVIWGATFDTNTLFVDSTNNRVWIGTIIPWVDLDVHDSDTSHIRAIISWQTNNPSIYMLADEANNKWWIYSTAPKLELGANNSIHMTILSAWNIGIGTSTPNNLVEIRETIWTNGTNSNKAQLRIWNDSWNANASQSIEFYQTNDSMILWRIGHTWFNSWGFDIVSWNVLNFVVDEEHGRTTAMHIKSNGNVGIGTTSPTSSLQVAGPISTAITTTSKTSAYTVTGNDSVITADSSGGAFIVTLPTAVGIAGRTYTFKKIDSSNNTVTVKGDGTETIEGDVNGRVMDNKNETLIIVSDGANWIVTWGNADPAFINGCGGNNSVTYEGVVYNTVEIGTQCWLNKSLNVGTQLPAISNSSNNSIIEKWCFDDLAGNNDANCSLYGAIYTWYEAMGYTATAGAQGICPNGWHIPTDNEWKTLEMFIGFSQATADSTGYRGTATQVNKLKSGGSTGFELLFGGYRNTSGLSFGPSTITLFWTSSEVGENNAWGREINLNRTDDARYYNGKALASKVRCIMD